MKLSDKQLATVLAALRHWQQDLDEGPVAEEFFVDDEPLSADEIDQLCEEINCEPVAAAGVNRLAHERVVAALRLMFETFKDTDEGSSVISAAESALAEAEVAATRTQQTPDPWWADDFTVRDENRLAVATACDADQAEQIAREHNAHTEMLAALKALEWAVQGIAYVQEEYAAEVAAALAAIAKAEGK